jgi:hypothetical protein
MRMTKRTLPVLLMLALAVPVVSAPATAVAQSAGDEQYVDPFQNEQGQAGGGQGGSGGGQGGSGGGDTSAPAPAPAPAPTEIPDGTVEGTVTQTQDAGPTLPRTGFGLAGRVLGGGLLLLGGLTLRRRT